MTIKKISLIKDSLRFKERPYEDIEISNFALRGNLCGLQLSLDSPQPLTPFTLRHFHVIVRAHATNAHDFRTITRIYTKSHE